MSKCSGNLPATISVSRKCANRKRLQRRRRRRWRPVDASRGAKCRRPAGQGASAMRGLAGSCFLALVLRAAIVTVQADSPNNVSLPVFYKVHLEDLKILRATAYTLLIQVTSCRQSCNTVNVKFKIKTSSSVSWWAPKDVRIHPSHNDTYNIGGLLPDTLYSVRAFISPPGTYTKTLVTYTCPERPAPVRGLRVAGAGPGWLDVRWAPPAPEVCVSDVEYETRYRPRGGLFTPLRVYGVVPGRRQGFVQMRPAHPCPAWPTEFCLLLVDAVLPGRNHTIEVQVHRVDGRRQEKAAVQSVEGYADPRPLTWGPDEGAPGGRGPPPSGGPHEAAVRSWFVVSLVALVLLLVFSGVVLVLLHRLVTCRLPSYSITRIARDLSFLFLAYPHFVGRFTKRQGSSHAATAARHCRYGRGWVVQG
ncbi:Protein of unknown function [Gryllus bimaculatus]|nr:Protein of unknown function [Gryllus bimaculatus]